ncbi:aerobic respiration two-component sensor histidine kinase ArcB [Planctobacterium marinum]|uniref:Aerobic respiration control sensor protein n=1 Tax=Planctobacterium marinum TaxID=1631968 RepID=A0AA48HV77_9ALTE|nr:aerobic respiration control sensor protein [Planctobacterium marinum]
MALKQQHQSSQPDQTKPEKIDSWAEKAARWISHCGATKSALVLFVISLLVTCIGSLIIRYAIGAHIELEDLITAIVLTCTLAPMVFLVFSALVKQLEKSRQQMQVAVAEMERMREADVLLHQELQDNINRLNNEIEARQQVQLDREKVFAELENQMHNRTEKEEQALRYSILLRSIIDASPDLIYYRNEEGKFAGCNRVAEQMTGKTEEELMGLTPHQVYDEELARQVVMSDNEVLESNASITEELWLRFADGRRRYYEMRKVPFFDPKGNRLGLLAFGRDITERKQAADAVKKASKDKTAFIATISHELRTPLNGIVGLSRMLRDTQLNKEQFNWVSTIYASAITLGNIFNDIIDLDKIERDRLELQLKTVNLKEFSQELGSIIELLAADKGLVYKTHLIEPIPPFLEADGTRLRQILWNLLFNAVKFTQQGHVSLTIEATMPEDGVSLVTFKITDTGVGIPEEELEKIFAMYYQVDHPNHKSATGTGIGLAICQQMVSMMKGHISVNSVLGEGTSFTVEIPMEVSSQGIRTQQLMSGSLDILLVEDIQLNVMVAKALLEKLGQKVSVAMTGEDALEQVRNHHYDLILLDIQLPDMNGFEVASILCEEGLIKNTRVVALTANVIKTRQEYLDNGMDDVIAKPIKKSRVIEVFNKLFAENEPQAQKAALSEPVVAPDKQLHAALDMELLEMLLDTIGIDMMQNSLTVFEQMMPNYLELLQLSLSAKEKSEVCGHAHKIKGAAGSVGLAAVQKVANKIQQGDHPAWWQNVYDWVDELQQAYEHDLQKLKDWMASQDSDID